MKRLARDRSVRVGSCPRCCGDEKFAADVSTDEITTRPAMGVGVHENPEIRNTKRV